MSAEQELRQRARELRAHPEFQRQIAKLTSQELLAWTQQLESDSEESNADAWYFLAREAEEDADRLAAKADRNLIVLTACLDELENRNTQTQEVTDAN